MEMQDARDRDCYTYETLHYEKGLFDKSVDVTYILTMDHAVDRHVRIREQLNQHHPTARVVIIYNKGYKKCSKTYKCGEIDVSYKDLTHAVMHIFDMSQDKNRILILEDDFIFNTDVTSREINDVTDFLVNNDPDVYSLGSLQHFVDPRTIGKAHVRLYFKGGAHSMIYSRRGRRYLQKEFSTCSYQSQDMDLVTAYPCRMYGYHKNIYAQTFPRTENRKNWGRGHPVYSTFCSLVFIPFLELFGFDNYNDIHSKYNYYNKCMAVLSIIIVAIVVMLLAKLLLKITLV